MIKSTLLAVLLVVPAIATPATPVRPESPTPATHAHSDDHQSQHAPAADLAVRWKADEPLRAGMRRIRAATETLARSARDRRDDAGSVAVTEELKAAVAAMFAQCQLAPAPDAALHPLLAEVLQASTRLSEGHDGAALEGLNAVLVRYAALFEDSGWSTRDAP